METKEWIITDGSNNQAYVQINDCTFLFRENRIINPETKETEVFEMEVCLDDYDWFEKVDACEAFGYSAEEVDKWITEGEEQPLITECIFELSA